MIYDAIVIGAGPAGLTAAIYLKRANLNVAIIEKAAPGGKMTQTFNIENYPGFNQISGPDLSLTMYEQVINLGTPHLYGDVQNIRKENNIFYIETDLETLQAKRVIVATGTVSRLLNVSGEQDYLGRGISFCAICDGLFYKGKEVAVIGAGNSAFEESLYLSRVVKKIHIINRNTHFRADAILVDEVNKTSNIQIYNQSEVVDFFGNGDLKGLNIYNKETKSTTSLYVDGVFIYIGFDPATEFLKNMNVLDERGYLIVNEDLESKVSGLFGAGDCLNKKIRQIATSIGDGALAASSVIRTCHK